MPFFSTLIHFLGGRHFQSEKIIFFEDLNLSENLLNVKKYLVLEITGKIQSGLVKWPNMLDIGPFSWPN